MGNAIGMDVLENWNNFSDVEYSQFFCEIFVVGSNEAGEIATMTVLQDII